VTPTVLSLGRLIVNTIENLASSYVSQNGSCFFGQSNLPLNIGIYSVYYGGSIEYRYDYDKRNTYRF